jgi:tetratricopeptide (TPR) repeat protein
LNHLGRFEEAKQNLEDRLAKALDREDNWIAGLNYISLGMCLMAMGDLETAVDILQKGKALQVLTENPMDMAGTQANLGLALCHVGKVEEAKEPLRNSLELVVKAHAYFPLIEVLPGIALVLAQEGPAQQLEAVTLFGLLQTETYYANSKLFMAISGHHLEAVVESLPAEAAQSALERGRNQEIWAAATALLERLHRDWD